MYMLGDLKADIRVKRKTLLMVLFSQYVGLRVESVQMHAAALSEVDAVVQERSSSGLLQVREVPRMNKFRKRWSCSMWCNYLMHLWPMLQSISPFFWAAISNAYQDESWI